MSQAVAVLGAGTMGSGIAQVAAQAGLDVLLYDIRSEYVQRGVSSIEESLRKRVERGKLEQQSADATLARIKTSTELDDAADSCWVIEAAPEDLALKRDLFKSIGEKCTTDCLFATNTSSLSITSIAAAARHPERVVGMHFFNPAPAMPLVEVIGGRQTSPDAAELAVEFARMMGKVPVIAADLPGFIVNRVARPYYGESLRILGEGTAGVAHIDSALRTAGFPMGPFELMDMIGIDVNFAVTKSVYEAFFHEPRYRPHPIQQRMVEAGTLGRKTGRGFYSYDNERQGDVLFLPLSPLMPRRGAGYLPTEAVSAFIHGADIHAEELDPIGAEIVVRVLALIINEAALALGEQVGAVRDVDRAMRLGAGYPKGPLGWGDDIGLDVVLSMLRTLQATFGDDRYRPAPLLLQLVASGAVGGPTGEGFHAPGERGMV